MPQIEQQLGVLDRNKAQWAAMGAEKRLKYIDELLDAVSKIVIPCQRAL